MTIETSKTTKKNSVANKVSGSVAGLQTRKYMALENVQREDSPGLKFYLFHAPSAEIYQWGLIDRMAPGKPKAIQRKLNKTKILRIREFLEYTGNTIATSVIVVFDDSAVNFEEHDEGGFGKLSISWKPSQPAGVIVDGQHRVIGAKEFSDNVHLNVIGITGADDTEGAFQFLVINNNSSRVNPSQVKALFTSYKEEDLVQRMLDSGSTNVDSEKITALDYFDGGADSPFKDQLKWPKNEYGFIAPNALESGLSEVQNRSALLGVQELEIDTFTGIWAAIKDAWPNLWNADTHLLEKACIQALTVYICDALEKLLIYSDDEIDYSDPELLSKGVRQVVKMLDQNFFDVQWAITGLDTRAGHQLLLDDLKRMASNVKAKRSWYSNLETVNIASVSGEKTKKDARPKKAKK